MQTAQSTNMAFGSLDSEVNVLPRSSVRDSVVKFEDSEIIQFKGSRVDDSGKTTVSKHDRILLNDKSIDSVMVRDSQEHSKRVLQLIDYGQRSKKKDKKASVSSIVRLRKSYDTSSRHSLLASQAKFFNNQTSIFPKDTGRNRITHYN